MHDRRLRLHGSLGSAEPMKTQHRMSAHPLYHTWENMRQRCNNPNNTGYQWYGGRGITVCERWDSFANFVADMGKRPDGMTLDRIDVNGNYEPDNCKWSTQTEQMRNQRLMKSNKTGTTGVWWNKKDKHYQVHIRVDGKSKYLGVFRNLPDAIAARKQAELEYWR